MSARISSTTHHSNFIVSVMGRAVPLSESEKSLILHLQGERKSVSEISKTLKRSRKVIINFLADPDAYGKRKSTGRPRAISKRQERHLLRLVSNSTRTAAEIAREAGISASARTVRRVIQAAPHLKRKKLKKCPPLTNDHKERRLAFARNHVQWTENWRQVLFSDEKKFNLDGPDGFAYYFHDLRKEEKCFSKRQMGGGSVMVWAGVGFDKKTDIVFISGRMNSVTYLEMIKDQIRKFRTEQPFTFQQDNAPIHTAKIVKEFFKSEKVDLLEWPAKSPDLSIIENVWGQLSRAVYADSRQFSSLEELKTAIQEEWAKISQEYIQNLFHSLPKRMIKLLEERGSYTGY